MSANKLEVMMELERRGALPSDKEAILAELRKRGVVPGSDEVQQQSGFSAGNMVGNIPSSAKQFAGDLVQPFIHPIETAKGVANLTSGVVDKLSEKLAGNLPEGISTKINKLNNWLVDKGVPLTRLPESPDEIKFDDTIYADSMGDFIASRYGSMDNLKKTVETDPVGALADLSMVFTLGGSAAARVPGMAGKAGAMTRKVGMAIEPLNVAKTTGRAVARTAGKLIPESLPMKMYESSAKFSTTLPKAKRAEMTKTALEYGIPPTSKGVEKASMIINELNTKIDDLINAADAQGKSIPKSAIYRNLKEVRRKVGGAKIEGGKDLRQVNRVAKMFDEHMKAIGKDFLTPSELQAFKKDAYELIYTDAKNLRSKTAVDEARKAMARAAKESIEKFADVKELNRQEGRLLELRDPLVRSSGRIENRNIMGISAPINIGAGAAAGGAGGAAAGTIMSILEHPKAKARLAIALENLRKAGLEGLLDQNMMSTLTQQGLFQAGRAKDEMDK